uniref:SMC hinge domain-containing protein n=1 Tax=Oncorhynchus tshawytscha TaxID=74940 RepID=A0AAZ3SQ28_ONCTS
MDLQIARWDNHISVIATLLRDKIYRLSATSVLVGTTTSLSVCLSLSPSVTLVSLALISLSLSPSYQCLCLPHSDPERDWDRSRVKGLLANLITVSDVCYSTGLEVVAGGKLYNVVVDTEVTGKKLLEKGELKRRYTIIPLNKISARTLNDSVVNTAKSLVGEQNVHTALSLVGYEADLRKAIYVFGSTLVCDTLDNASSASAVLSSLQELREVQDSLSATETELQALDKQLSGLKGTAERYRLLKQQLDMKTEELDILQVKLHQSSFHKQQEELKMLLKTIEECEETLRSSKEVQKKADEKYKVLEDKMRNAEAEREKELKAAQQKVNSAKTKADAFSKKLKERQQEAESLVLELEELKREQTGYEQQILAVDEAMKTIQEQIDNMSTTVAENKDRESRVLLARLTSLFSLYPSLSVLYPSLSVLYPSLSLPSIHLSPGVSLLEEHEWINTGYDFKVNNPKEAGQRLRKLEESKSRLERSVNKRAMNMLSQAEERYNDLMKKKRIVENDKSKILQTIEELDQKKKEALNIAWQKVNKDFGSIFSTLLPGADARLAPPEGCGALEGLEFKVALGNTWKENLTELSGGQRSLVALSLILAMLLFKPAPIYILDEVDAALDLSHTQNIGQMLRTHFTHSQFVVVSLKDGMFTNANVLFKTKFVDGVSAVSRTTQAQPDQNKGPRKGPSHRPQAQKKNR